MSILIPEPETVSIDQLKVDGQNPNKMTDRQLKSLAESIQRFGFIVPIITNKDLLIADGEQRWIIAKSLGMKQVSVIRLPVEDVDRRLLRQVLNKLRGEHELLADAYEFERIIQAGHEEDLKQLLDLSDAQLEHYLAEIREPIEIPPPQPLEEIKTDIQQGDKFLLGNSELICGDCIEAMDMLSKDSVDFVMFSPPYWGLRDYGVEGQIGAEPHPTEYINNIQKICQKIKDILKKTGSLYIVIGDSYAGSGVTLPEHKRTVRSIEERNIVSGFMPKEKPQWTRIRSNWIQPKQKLMIPSRVAIALQDDGWLLRNEIVWAKGNPEPESVEDRFSQSWESIFFFTRERDYYFFLEAVLEPLEEGTYERIKHYINPTKDQAYGSVKINSKKRYAAQVTSGKIQGRHPRDVWNLPRMSHSLPHPAIYPEHLCVIPILASCPPEGIVLDPMAGAGTTLLVAEKLGRRFIGIDINPKYCQVIIDRWEAYTKQKSVKISENNVPQNNN
jgi:DNA modification methylase